MVPRNDDAFELLGRTVITGLMRTGAILPIYDKWFVGEGTVNMPLNETNRMLYKLQGINP